MGRAPCCEKQGLKRGPWSPEEDKLLVDYIQAHGYGTWTWRSLPRLAGLLRCGKSCRLRWTNYLRPHIKRGSFTPEEEMSIVQLHAIVGNKWSVIAAHLQGRTDNEIKNYWNTHLKKRLLRVGINPDTTTTTTTSTTAAAKLNSSSTFRMAQWESAVPLEVEARLSHESLLSTPSSTSTATDPSPEPTDFFLRIWNSPIGDAFRKPATSASCAAAPAPPPHTSSPLQSSNITTNSNEPAEVTSEEEDSYRGYFNFAAGEDDLGFFFQGQRESCCYSSLFPAELNECLIP